MKFEAITKALKRMGVMLPNGKCLEPPADVDWNAFRARLVRELEADGYEVHPGEVYWWKGLVLTGWGVIGKNDMSYLGT